MSENKFIARLKGEPTPKSVVEIQNDRLVAPFKSSPMGHIADRDSSVVVAKGAQNWAVNQGQLVPVADDYIGTESDLTATSRVSGAGLWLNATYTFPATGDETNPVSAIIAPSAKWVLTLCGDSLITQNGSVITLTMLVKIGATHLTTKQFKIRECASQFSQRLAIDFSESEQKVIKAHGGSPLTVQVLCDDEGASATIYSGMTHLTLLQRKIDADLVATDNVLLPEFIENLLEGYIIPADYFSRYDYIEQVEDGGKAMPEFTRNGDNMSFSGWAKPATEVYSKTEIDDKFTVANAQIDANADAIQKTREDYVKKSGDTMTGDLGIVSDTYKTSANISVEGARGRTTIRVSDSEEPGVYSQFELNRSGTFVARTISGTSINYGQVGAPDVPMYNVYTKRLNNGADLIVPTEGGTLARLEDVANKQDKLTAGDNIIISNNVISATGAGGGAGFDIVVVQELPATGQKGIIYLLAKDGTAPDVYDEYVWITATQTFELIGTTAVDLSGYLPTTGGTGDGKYVFKLLLDNAYTVGKVIELAPYTTSRDLTESTISVGNGFMRLGTDNYLTIHGISRYFAPDTNGNWRLGKSENSWQNVYTQKLNNGADIAIPTTGGTMALAENVETAIADAVANIDALPDQSGNAGKVLMTDGSTASWQAPQGGGTKVIIKRYE